MSVNGGETLINHAFSLLVTPSGLKYVSVCAADPPYVATDGYACMACVEGMGQDSGQ